MAPSLEDSDRAKDRNGERTHMSNSRSGLVEQIVNNAFGKGKRIVYFVWERQPRGVLSRAVQHGRKS